MPGNSCRQALKRAESELDIEEKVLGKIRSGALPK